jgi:MFS family permease
MTVRSSPEQRRTLSMASLSTLLVLLTFVTPLGTGIRTAATLHTGLGGQAWLLSSMSVGLAAALLAVGVMSDDYGRRRVYTVGLVLVALGAVMAAAAGSTGVFVAGRVVQGVGAAAVLASALGLIGHTFPAGPARSRAAAVWGASVGAGTGFGGLLTVVLDHGQGWRTTYVVTAVLAVVLAVAGRVLLLESGGSAGRRVDLPGIVLLGGGLTSLLAGLVQSRGGWDRPVVLALLAAGLLLLVGFLIVERRSAAPLIDVRLFVVPGFVAATLAAFVIGAAVIGAASFLPTLLQRGLGDTLLVVTVLVFIWSATSTVAALALRWLPGLSGQRLLVVGLLISAVGLGALGILEVGASSARLVPGLVVLGVGYGAVNAALGREAVAHVPAQKAGMGSGANNTARYMGAAVGVTLVVLLVGAAEPVGSPAGLLAGWNQAALAGAAVTVVGALAVAGVGRRRP